MKEKFRNRINWGLSILDTIDFIAWRTKQLFGISKTELYKKAIRIADRNKDLSEKEKIKLFEKELQKERRTARQKDIYEEIKNNLYIDPIEAERRLRYFSEDYLNKEFDIFMNLVSDKYINYLYSRIFKIKKGKWNSFGNGASFNELTSDIPKLANDMQMDNLVYDFKNKVLIANELKLGAKKNKDQILKYSYLFLKLKENDLIDKNTKFYLLFLGVNNENIDKDSLKIEVERNKNKKLDKKVQDNAKNIEISNLTWNELIKINKTFLEKLDIKKQQTEIKLIQGFNSSLEEKFLIRK